MPGEKNIEINYEELLKEAKSKIKEKAIKELVEIMTHSLVQTFPAQLGKTFDIFFDTEIRPSLLNFLKKERAQILRELKEKSKEQFKEVLMTKTANLINQIVMNMFRSVDFQIEKEDEETGFSDYEE